VIGCMGIFMRDSTFIDSLKYFHKCVKKEIIEIILSFFLEGRDTNGQRNPLQKGERDNKN